MAINIFKSSKIGGATAIIAFSSFISYAIGLLRDRIIAVNFGTTNLTDAYNASFLIPDFLFNLFIAGALTAAFLPMFTEYLVKDKEEAYKIANTMLTGSSIVITTLAILAFIFMPFLTPILFSKADPEMQKNIIQMTRLMLPSAILFAISNTLGNILMSYKHFTSYAISPILYNTGIIVGVIIFEPGFGIYSAATGVLIGAGLHCLIRIIDVFKTPYRYRPQLHTKHPAFKKILKLMVPKSISLIAWQLNLYIFAIAAVNIEEGGFAAFNFARNIQSFAVSLFGISFATAVFPDMAEAMSKNNKNEYTRHIQNTIQRVLFFTIPSAIGVMLLAKPLVELILSGGVFEEKSIYLTAIILFFFALSIPFESLSHIFARAFYALKNTFTPMLINVSSMVVIATITLFVAPKFGIEWFSIGFSIGFVFYTILMIIFLKKHLIDFNLITFAKSISRTIIATGIMAAVILMSDNIENIVSIKMSHILRIIIGTLTFFAAAILLKSPEISSIKYLAGRALNKKTNEQ